MLIRIIKHTLIVLLVHQLAVSSSYAAGENSLDSNHTLTTSQLNESYSFDFDFDVQKFLIRFVVEHIGHHSRLNISDSCMDRWIHLRTNLIRSYYDSIKNKSSYWSLKVIDSYGKSPSGFLKQEGAYFWVGDYSECLKVLNESWNGKYCVLDTGLPGPNTHYNKVFKVGLCMPEKCTDDDIAKLIDKAYDVMPKYMNGILSKNAKSIECKQKEKKLTPQAIVSLSIIGVMLTMVLVATITETIQINMKHFTALIPKLRGNKKKESNEDIVRSEVDISVEQVPKKDEAEKGSETKITKTAKQKAVEIVLKVLKSFSAYSNLKRVFNTKTHPMDIESLHAIRFVSQYWIIISHSYLYILPFLDNAEHYKNINQETTNVFYYIVAKIVSQGYLAVDSFLVMNGLLTSYIGLKFVFHEKFKFNPQFLIKFFLHRYIRLTPVYMVVFMAHITLSPYLGQGPYYPNEGFETGRCSKDWWTHLLYMNNLVMVDDCFGHSWYLACEMQIGLVMPFLLYFFKIKIWKTNLGVISTLFLIVANIVVIFSISFTSSLDYNIYDHFIYIAPWSRIGASLIGLLIGYLLFNFKRKQRVIVIKKYINVTCWILVSAVMLVIALYFNYTSQYTSNLKDKILGSIYQSIFRLIWSVCLGYIIYACTTSNGGIISKIFSWPIWKPLSRLTYSTYLIHVTVIYFVIYMSDKPPHKVEFETGAYFLSNVLYSYIMGLVISIVFELPFDLLEKQFIFKKRRSHNHEEH